MLSHSERLAIAEGFVSDLLAVWDASGREDVPAETVDELARIWGFLVDVPAGKHVDCEACSEGFLSCTELRLPGDIVPTRPGFPSERARRMARGWNR